MPTIEPHPRGRRRGRSRGRQGRCSGPSPRARCPVSDAEDPLRRGPSGQPPSPPGCGRLARATPLPSPLSLSLSLSNCCSKTLPKTSHPVRGKHFRLCAGSPPGAGKRKRLPVGSAPAPQLRTAAAAGAAAAAAAAEPPLPPTAPAAAASQAPSCASSGRKQGCRNRPRRRAPAGGQ